MLVKNTNDVPALEVGSSSDIIIIDNNKDVGDIPMSKWKLQTPFDFVNNWTESVTLWAATTSCMCTEAIVVLSGDQSPTITMHTTIDLDLTIAPWEKARLVAVFDPNAHGPDAIWPINRHVYIETNSAKTPQLDFVFNGDVIK